MTRTIDISHQNKSSKSLIAPSNHVIKDTKLENLLTDTKVDEDKMVRTFKLKMKDDDYSVKVS